MIKFNRFSITFLLLGVVCVPNGVAAVGIAATVILFSVRVSSLAVGTAYTTAMGWVFFKRPDGTIGPLGWAMNWPFFLLNYLTLYLYKWSGREAAVSEITAGLYLGRRLSGREAAMVELRGIGTILDLTAEFAEAGLLRRKSYLNIPILDYTAPDAQQLDNGIAWIERGLENGGVFVRCALGHGRSATFVVAFLVKHGTAENLDEAVQLVSGCRTGVRLSDIQYQALESYFGLQSVSR